MCNRIYLSWQSQNDRSWHVVGRLDRFQGKYRFVYTKGATHSKFLPLAGMPNIYKQYESDYLFPVFENRLLSTKRPEYQKFIRWLDLDVESVSALDVLARSEGRKATDQFQVFPDLTALNGRLEVCFFVHGTSHMEDADIMISSVRENEKLLLQPYPENPADKKAVLICADNPYRKLGYLPRYLASVMSDFIQQSPELVDIRLKKISLDAPVYYQLLCSMVCDVSGLPNQQIKLSEEYQPVV